MRASDVFNGLEPLTPIELKRINQKSVYDYIYEVGTTSKLDISINLKLSLPTVAASVSTFMEQGLVVNSGVYSSTGGRKAQMFACNEKARIAIGVEVLKEQAQIVAIDLYAAILQEATLEVPFQNNDEYYRTLGAWINNFVDSLPFDKSFTLGVGIALQGLISFDGETVSYSEILNATGVTRNTFQQYIDLPCVLIHDTEAAALSEVWKRKDLSNAIYLALNRNFGGTLILNGHVQNTRDISSGCIEHMCINPNGELCYCGKQGCVETFCSANSLKNAAQIELDEFFSRVHSGDARSSKIWRNYLRYLAITIDNIRMIVDGEFILGGYLMQYINDDDLALLIEYVKQQCAFDASSFTILTGRYREKAPKLGAGIALIDRFFNSF